MDTHILFPTVSGTSLEGTRLDLPGQFRPGMNLALLGFWDWQQPMLDSWLAAAAGLDGIDLTVFEFPVIQATNDEVHEFIDAGMRAGITDQGARERTVTLYVDKREFMRSLDLTTDDEVYAMLVDDRGRVLHRWEGSITPQAAVELAKLASHGVAEAQS